MNDQILELLGSGLSPAMTSNVLGITESRISQLLSNEDFAAKVVAKRMASAQGLIARDGKYDKIEDKLLESLENSVRFLVDPMKVLRALQVINAAKRRGAPALEQQPITAQTIVQLQVPVIVAAKFVLNGQKEVVEIDGRSMAPLSHNGVLSKLKEMQSDDASRSLPAPRT